ncbi:uncharacterized protein LOC126721263 [Quercus robur]|uniref:uncharacterized protein LOC126721263 n=1 Tax=Quercus robur TaxID=38942 RepID=UPI002162DE30|nr:uncharacterized protein LOC126721263 [Quercus robur]
MARRKANLRTRPKSVTLERASSQDADEVGDQEMHEASTQVSTQASTQGSDVQPAIRVTRGPKKYLEIWDLPDDQEIELPLNSMHRPVDEGERTFTGFLGTIARKHHMCPIKYLDWKVMPEELKEECWHLVKQKYQVNDNPKAYEGLKKFTLQKIGKAWRDHKCRLKAKYYISHSRNKARVKSNGPRKCIPKDWNILVDHWYFDDAVAKTDGHPVERAVLFQILHTCKDGSAVNPVMKEKMDKMKDLLVDPKNQLQSSDTSGSIARSTDDVFVKLMGKESKGRIRGVGFGPTLSGQSSKIALTDSEIQSSQPRDNEIAQLKAFLATMEEKLVGFNKMKEKLVNSKK